MLGSIGINDMFIVAYLIAFRKAVNLKQLGSGNKYCYYLSTRTLKQARNKDNVVT